MKKDICSTGITVASLTAEQQTLVLRAGKLLEDIKSLEGQVYQIAERLHSVPLPAQDGEICPAAGEDAAALLRLASENAALRTYLACCENRVCAQEGSLLALADHLSRLLFSSCPHP